MGQEDDMRVTRITANLHVPEVDGAKRFYTDFLGLSTEEFDMGWVTRLTSPDTGVSVQLVTGDASAPEDSVVSVHTTDVDAAYAEAQAAGYEIVYPLTTEPWGVRRFFVRAPDGNVLNIVRHHE
ncbi:glyoxalase [Rhodococcus hoagii]|nr:glyoxalase [Prescottella equi]NKS18111.1 glyoxalase [Prescottella equi]NKS21227.1 glyoxalase [Prescottella equi]NKS63154.1 glyoxalase [Prescottella equi]NKS72651.1 glyoxalase [Prescottella equi]